MYVSKMRVCKTYIVKLTCNDTSSAQFNYVALYAPLHTATTRVNLRSVVTSTCITQHNRLSHDSIDDDDSC